MGVHGNLFMSSKLIRGASPKCGPALTWSLSDSSAATTHRQRSQNVRNQVECLRTKGRQRDGGVYSGGHMGREHASREKKLTMVNFLSFVQKNVSTIRFQEIKIRPWNGFEKMRFLCFYIIKSMARKGYFGPKSDFRGSKIPPRGASSTWNM